MTPQLYRFYQNWIGKAENYSNDILSDQFDKFASLFVVFNALYMEVSNELRFAGQQLPRD